MVTNMMTGILALPRQIAGSRPKYLSLKIGVRLYGLFMAVRME
jgi:hypothetical protein